MFWGRAMRCGRSGLGAVPARGLSRKTREWRVDPAVLGRGGSWRENRAGGYGMRETGRGMRFQVKMERSSGRV
jgi:hypothetical protein